jgi:hypothetical protein
VDDRKLYRNGLPGDRSFASYLGSTDVLEADFWTAITSVLPVIREEPCLICIPFSFVGVFFSTVAVDDVA